MAFFIDVDDQLRAVDNRSVLQVFVSEEKIKAKVLNGKPVTHSVYADEEASIAAFPSVVQSIFGGASGGGEGSCSDCDGSRVVLGSGKIKHKGGRLSEKITIPAGAEEISISSKDHFWVTTDGLTDADKDKIGIPGGHKATLWIRGQELIKNIRIDSDDRNVWIEFYSISNSALIGGGHH